MPTGHYADAHHAPQMQQAAPEDGWLAGNGESGFVVIFVFMSQLRRRQEKLPDRFQLGKE